ncbi:hypothetical protein CYMTET_29746, partial [Cymbomonas tetramitiformis]
RAEAKGYPCGALRGPCKCARRWIWEQAGCGLQRTRVAAAVQGAELAQYALEDLSDEEGVKTRHLHAYIELVKETLQEMQRALEGEVPRVKCVLFDKPAGGGSVLKPVVPAEVVLRGVRAEACGARGSGPARGGRASASAGGRVRGGVSAEEVGPSRWAGEFRRKPRVCESWEDGDGGFTGMVVGAPEGARNILLQFRRWMRVQAAVHDFEHTCVFYERVIFRMERDASVTFELVSFAPLWELCRREEGINPKNVGRGQGTAAGGAGWEGEATIPGDLLCAHLDERVQVSQVQARSQTIADGGAGKAEHPRDEGDMQHPARRWPRMPGRRERATLWEGLQELEAVPVRDAAEAELEEPYIVPNYEGAEHDDVMTGKMQHELWAGRIFNAGAFWPRRVSALGMVERLREGKLKYRPIWDYSRPHGVEMNDRIDLYKDEFATVQNAYAWLRAGKCMAKVNRESAYQPRWR